MTRLPEISTVFGGSGAEKKVLIRVYFPASQRRIYRATGVKVLPEHWKDGRVSERNPNHIALNHKISEKMNMVLEIRNSCILRRIPFTPQSLIRSTAVNTTFNLWCEGQLSGIRFSTVLDKKSTLKHLNCFGILDFSDLTPRTVSLFNDYLIKKGLKTNSIWKIHKNLKTFISKAIVSGLIEKNPYDSFSPKRATHTKYALSAEQVNTLLTLPVSKVLDMFLLSCCTGLRYSDIVALAPNNIRTMYGELWILIDEMKKVEGRKVKVKANEYFPCGEEVLKRNLPELFSNISNLEANKKLKEIQGMAGITGRPLTFHISRHTYLTRVAQMSGSIFKVMEKGGISNVSTAQGYVDLQKFIN